MKLIHNLEGIVSKNHYYARLDKMSGRVVIANSLKILIIFCQLGYTGYNSSLRIDLKAWKRATLPGIQKKLGSTQLAKKFEKYINKICNDEPIRDEERISEDLLNKVVTYVTGMSWYKFETHSHLKPSLFAEEKSTASLTHNHYHLCRSHLEAWQIVNSRILPFVDTIIFYGFFASELIKRHENQVVDSLRKRNVKACIVLQCPDSPDIDYILRRCAIYDRRKLRQLNEIVFRFQDKANRLTKTSVIQVVESQDILSSFHQGFFTANRDCHSLVLPSNNAVEEGNEVYLQLIQNKYLDKPTREVAKNIQTLERSEW